MVTPIVPSHNLVFILVEIAGCVVARYIETGPFMFAIERAANWEDLADKACMAVVEQIGAIVVGEHWSCSPELAERATWGGDYV